MSTDEEPKLSKRKHGRLGEISERILGSSLNDNGAVRFVRDGRCISITQTPNDLAGYDDDPHGIVILTPKQVKALVAFIH